MIKLQDTYIINEYYLPYIINDDFSGLNDSEILLVDNWLKDKKGTFDLKEQDGQFATCEICKLKSDCYEVDLYIDEN